MAATLSKLRREDRSDSIFFAVISVLGILLLIASIAIGAKWYLSPEPAPQSFQPYITPQAEVLQSSFYQSGLPRFEISMEEFMALAKDKPYFVTYSSKWQTESPPSYIGSVYYSLHVSGPAGDRYVSASQDIPDYSEISTFGWNAQTAYNPETRQFSLKVTGTNYGWAITAAILLVVGALFLLIGFTAGQDLWGRLKLRA